MINGRMGALYPSIMINYEMLGSATEVYKSMRDERIRIKHTDPLRQAALKLILNSIFGLLKQEFSLLFNPKASTSVCSIGQCLLTDLGNRLAPTVTICQYNTDGIAFIPHTDDWKRIWKEWEQDHNLTLEDDHFKLFHQRDVNNYIAVEHDKKLPDGTIKKGKIKVKGSDVNLYHVLNPDKKERPSMWKPHIAAINHIALVDYLVSGKDIIETYIENLDKPHLFQYVLHTGGTYDGTFDTEGNQYNKVNRVFATKKGDFCVYKKKGETLAKFPNAPSTMYIHNKDCSEIKDFNRIVDLNHYYDLLIKKLEKWE